MKVSKTFSGEYLKATDLDGGEHTVTISSVEVKKFDNGKGMLTPKLLIHFQDREKGLVANKTNAKRIALLYGDETDDWVGKEIILYPDMVDYQGDPVESIRVRGAIKKTPNQASGVPDDEIPF